MKRGDRFECAPSVAPANILDVVVTRVARDGDWADIRVTPRQPGAKPWTKRQRRPFPSTFRAVKP